MSFSMSRMQNSEKLCLKWNDFQENTISSFEVLRNDQEFADVTLACEDGTQVEAHKVILASSSPFFMEILKRNKNPHPLIYMRGIKADEMVAMVDFLYCGEAKVNQENLDSFLALAEELRLEGLTSGAGGNNGQEHVPEKIPLQSFAQKEQPSESQLDLPNPINVSNLKTEQETSSKLPVALFSVEAHQLDEEIKSMMEVSENMVQIGNIKRRAKICKVCGKEGQTADIMRHIEAHHIISQVSHACDICGKVSRSRHGLRAHKSRDHCK